MATKNPASKAGNSTLSTSMPHETQGKWVPLTKSFEQITGFWTREGVLIGVPLAKVSRPDNAFFVFRLTERGGNIKDKEEGEMPGEPGQIVGVPYSAVLSVLDDKCGVNMTVRLTPHGKKANNKGAEFWDIKVERLEEPVDADKPDPIS